MAEHVRRPGHRRFAARCRRPGGQVDSVISTPTAGRNTVSTFRESLCRVGDPPLDGRCGVEYRQRRGLVAALKRELPHGPRWATPQRAPLDVFGLISFYNK